jgi:hypothetical protein
MFEIMVFDFVRSLAVEVLGELPPPKPGLDPEGS